MEHSTPVPQNSNHKRPRTAIDASRGIGTSAFSIEPERARIIGHDTPHKKGEHCLWQKRCLESVDEALAQHMAKYGFTSVIEVRKDGGEFIDVVSGRRRVKAARRANEIRAELGGLEPIKVKCQVVRGSDLDMKRRMVSENALRKDVHPLDMAEDLQGMLDIGASEEDAALSCGKTLQQFRQILRLLDLDAEVQDAIREDVLSVSAGIKLADLTRDEQKAELATVKAGQGSLTAAAVASRVKARKSGGEAVQAPGKRLLVKLLASGKAEAVFGPDGVRALRYAMGDLGARNIAGLTDLIREVE